MTKFVSRYVGPYIKAHVAGLGAGLSVMLTDANGNLGALGNLSANQWWGVVAATGLLGSAVAYVVNIPAPAAPAAAPAPAPLVEPAPVAPVAQDA